MVEKRDLDRLLRPRSVAIVGISPEIGSIGAAVLSNLNRFGFPGDIHLVSRTRSEVDGRPCLPSIDDLPVGVDVAVFAVPVAALRDAVGACVRRKVGAGVIFAAGFAETGEMGAMEQQIITQMARDGRMALVGPNCIGLTNFSDRIPLTYEPVAPPSQEQKPSIGLIAQSGAMLSALRIALTAKGLALSVAISTGNEADLGTEDFLEFVVEDEGTRVVIIFAEQIREPKRFLDSAKRARSKNKPIVLMHPGRSSRARESALTHTGAIAGDYKIMATMVERHAVLLVDTIEELLDTAELLGRFRNAPSAGAGIITNSGAFKGFALDFCESIGLEIPKLQPQTVKALQSALPAFATVDNPLDTTGQTIKAPWIFRDAVERLAADDGIGCIAVAIVPGAPEQAMAKAAALLEANRNAPKPMAVAAMVDEGALPAEFASSFRDNGVAVFRSPERMLRAIAHVTRYGRLLSDSSVSVRDGDVPTPSIPISREGVIPEYESKAVLVRLGIPVPRGGLAPNLAAAQNLAADIGFPVVLKAQSPQLSHKSDAGGVIVGVSNPDDLVLKWEQLHRNIATARPELVLEGVLVEEMARPGTEMVVGGRRDPDWGPVLMIGLGGIWIEALQDFRLFSADLSAEAIVREVLRLKGAALLQGSRGRPAADIEALSNTISKIGGFLQAHPHVREIDLNPLMVYPGGVLALDALIVTSPPF